MRIMREMYGFLLGQEMYLGPLNLDIVWNPHWESGIV